jgi:CBS domain-containing protein
MIATMNSALADVEKFLAATPPFDLLEPALLQRAAAAIEAFYRRKGTVLLEFGALNETLYIVRRGAVEAHDRHGNLVDRYGEGESFGLLSLLTGKPVRFRITLIEDGLIWCMPRAVLDELRAGSPEFDTYYICSIEERLIATSQSRNSSGQTLFMTPMGELVKCGLVVATPDTSIAEAARRMSQHGVSSLLVSEEEHVRGIVTDRDLRNRVLAQGRDTAEPVAAIMTPEPLTLDADSPVLEGILAMAGRGIHHLPLTRDGRVVGMLTTRDLMTLQTQHPLYLAAQIQKADSIEALIRTCQQVPRLFDLMVASGMRAEQVPKVLTTINDAVTRRLIGLAEQQLGPSPAPFAWLAFGSQARAEQSIKTDQDNGLVYADDAPPQAEAWFASLARIVCDGLDACGYPYCPGQIMATTDDWRRPLSGWLAHFRTWAAVPDPGAVLRISIFFDLRAVYGDQLLAAQISEALGECGSGRGKGVFITALARQAAGYDVPLGFFRRFVLASKGEHRETLEIKASGLMPLTDLVRVRALEAGITVPGTQARIAQLVEANRLSRRDADRLAGAHVLLSGLRVRLHAEQVRRGEQPHNHLDPTAISHAERAALREAFLVIREAQRGLNMDFSV